MKNINKIITNISETKIWFFENINKIDKNLARLIKKKKREESNQNQKLKRRGYNRQCRTQRIVRDYYEQLYDNKIDNLEKMDRFLSSIFQN